MAAYSYDIQAQKQQLSAILEKNLSDSLWAWVQEHTEQALEDVRSGSDFRPFQVLFSRVARKVQQPQVASELPEATPSGVYLSGDLSQIARFWLLLQLPVESEKTYIDFIETLFKRADMQELVVLYRALPLLAFADHWIWRCTEGVRSNIGEVLKAVMLDNPYPKQYLDQSAWNQLILKAFFTEQDVSRIQGEPERRNPALARALKDYRDERLSARRSLPVALEDMIKKNEIN